jgi:hypothetical protein
MKKAKCELLEEKKDHRNAPMARRRHGVFLMFLTTKKTTVDRMKEQWHRSRLHEVFSQEERNKSQESRFGGEKKCVSGFREYTVHVTLEWNGRGHHLYSESEVKTLLE